LEREIRCFPYGEHSDVPRLQQVEQKAVGRQRNLGLGKTGLEQTSDLHESKQIISFFKHFYHDYNQTLIVVA
jgi:hypothetical protein